MYKVQILIMIVVFIESYYADKGKFEITILTERFFYHGNSAQRVPEPDPLPGISLHTRPDPIQF